MFKRNRWMSSHKFDRRLRMLFIQLFRLRKGIWGWHNESGVIDSKMAILKLCPGLNLMACSEFYYLKSSHE